MKISMEAVNIGSHFRLSFCKKDPIIYLNGEDWPEKQERKGFWFSDTKRIKIHRLNELIECCEVAIIKLKEMK